MLFKRAVLLLILTPLQVDAREMIADIFTKSTDKATFIRMRNAMMNIHGTLKSTIEASYRTATGQLRRAMGSMYDALCR